MVEIKFTQPAELNNADSVPNPAISNISRAGKYWRLFLIIG
jgi:hypothetical protein